MSVRIVLGPVGSLILSGNGLCYMIDLLVSVLLLLVLINLLLPIIILLLFLLVLNVSLLVFVVLVVVRQFLHNYQSQAFLRNKVTAHHFLLNANVFGKEKIYKELQ